MMGAMTRSPVLGPRAFLKSLGFATDKRPHQIDNALLLSLNASDRDRLRSIWAVRNAGLGDGLEMYGVPKTSKQAALLFSYDWPRAAATMAWFAEVVVSRAPRSVTEMGCGAGFLLAYLKRLSASVEFSGIEEMDNLAQIARDLAGANVIAGDYLAMQPTHQSEMLLCDFGFDLSRLAPSDRPHGIADIAGQEFCPNCSDDMKVQLDDYMRAWRRWGTDDAWFALAGRVGNFGVLRAFVLAANDANWVIDLDRSRILAVRNVEGGVERFPALIFGPPSGGRPRATLEDCARFFARQ